MILTFVFLFLILLAGTAAIYYLFVFFVPALKLKYQDYNENLASNFNLESKRFSSKDAEPSKVAVIENHQENKLIENRRLFYEGEKNCSLFHSVYRSEYTDSKICIGFGDCVKHCPQSAIIVKDNPYVETELCNGCGKCVDVCPEKLISLADRNCVEKSSESSQKNFKFWGYCYKLFKVLY